MQESTDEIDVRGLLALVVTGDPAAAPRLRALAARLCDLAARLESTAARPPTDNGGVSDRVRMAVVGPDGVVRATTDTGASHHAD